MTSVSNAEKLLRSVNPASKKLIAETAVTPLADIPAIVSRASDASAVWRKLSIKERLEKVKAFRNQLVFAVDSMSKLISEEMGKPLTEAMVSEVFAVLETCQWLESKAEKILENQAVDLNPVFFIGKRSYNVFQALGVVAVVSPWNYPFSIPASTALLALVAGNAVVLKPSPKTPLVAAALLELLHRSGFPADLVSIVQGDVEECRQLILSGVNRVVFTGSVQGGKAIMQTAAEKLVPVTLELGGKHPAIVLADVEEEAAVSGLLWCAFTNAGQACASIDRLFLQKPLDKSLLPKLIEAAQKLRLGDPLDSRTEIGPLVDSGQLERVLAIVEDARKKGARLLCGGKVREDLGGYFLEPTLLTDLSAEMRIMQEEIFGPVLPIVFVDTAQEALARANDSKLGLAASVWTADLKKGEELAKELQAGVVFVNDGLFSHVCPDVPWGGIKESGFGKAHSEYELLELVCIKNVSLSPQGLRDWHFPYSEAARNYIKAGIELLHKGGLAEKLSALKTIISLKPGLRK